MQLEKALNEYVELKEKLEPQLAELKAMEAVIKQHVLDTGEVAETQRAKVSIRKGYVRSSWDNKALRGYAAAKPEILEFCKESEVAPAVVIMVK